ncbi:hypothetical protein BD324DRAFT_680547 [Kockovaella imperatae]|uniref:Uncharacterized protein n=1 Tax=Kockovaella imperatae TaxID=4999 RepID=A0A1Y1UHV8_9TREE|nr:hypothetical protein BD324DRAFT_680547 [Kockovaella imperatae]ORX37641.1 hypothetical protein BD324DRAFT_680547 [Kockovaella imperatae]
MSEMTPFSAASASHVSIPVTLKVDESDPIAGADENARQELCKSIFLGAVPCTVATNHGQQWFVEATLPQSRTFHGTDAEADDGMFDYRYNFGATVSDICHQTDRALVDRIHALSTQNKISVYAKLVDFTPATDTEPGYILPQADVSVQLSQNADDEVQIQSSPGQRFIASNSRWTLSVVPSSISDDLGLEEADRARLQAFTWDGLGTIMVGLEGTDRVPLDMDVSDAGSADQLQRKRQRTE